MTGIIPQVTTPLQTDSPKIALYLTNRCNLACVFCPRFSHQEVSGYSLKLAREADLAEFIRAIGDPSGYREIVFCGYGEPTLRLRLILTLSQHLKKRWPEVPLRLNTNGLANLMYGYNILPQLHGRIDAISISLNADREEIYQFVRDILIGLHGSHFPVRVAVR